MPKETHFIMPQPQGAAEIFTTHQLAWEFRREREDRLAHQHHCQWYRAIARQHQAELARYRQTPGPFCWLAGRGHQA